ncbi:RagB/SusD family nutrient uptake outer membrane protein [uncultured Bacteroides sp.]|uniref:RagB/SusD family nutrient uptake outer membrane protein n=1 Tax=uncultured Bacteroides sp. TaxID=162156 RepID=UPI002613336E|nr:RagB/SusD family nutrient uptake outer membrane protein [uncultured Bacteroides sp.]
MKKIFILAALVAACSSCSDFIDQDNRSNVPQADFYNTKAGYTSLINSAYSSLRTTFGGDPWLFESGTDLYASGRTAVDKIGLLGAGYDNSVSSVSDFYADCYKAIALANDAIYYGNSCQDFAEKAQYIDEARFLRAFYYLLMVQQFGDVVLITDHVSSGLPPTARTSAADVYKFIIDELTDLYGENSHLLDKATGANFGHADKRTVAHFLAKAYLTRGYESYAESSDFQNAKNYADKVIAASNGLTLPFAQLMDVDNEQDDEIIFSCIYSKESVADPINDGSKQQAHFCDYLDGQEAGHKYTSSTLTPTLRMHELFNPSINGDANDERYAGTFMTTLYNHYWDFYKEDADRSKINIFAYYPASWMCADTTAWRNADLEHRKDAYIIPMTEMGWGFNKDKSARTYNSYHSKVTDEVYGVACFRKFDDKNCTGFSMTNSMHDVYIARLAETYLVAAEAAFKMGDNGAAADYINKVRTRAKAKLISASDVTIDYILDERARELAGENVRWMDLKRTGKLKEYAIKYNPDITSEDQYKGVDGQDKILRPIPLSAIELNSALTQNPGYGK